MSSASPGATHRKPTRRPGRKAPTLRPHPNTSGTAGVRVVRANMPGLSVLSVTSQPGLGGIAVSRAWEGPHTELYVGPKWFGRKT